MNLKLKDHNESRSSEAAESWEQIKDSRLE